jgi:hypothetical protein
MTWTALHLALAAAATIVLCSTELLNGSAGFFVH